MQKMLDQEHLIHFQIKRKFNIEPKEHLSQISIKRNCGAIL